MHSRSCIETELYYRGGDVRLTVGVPGVCHGVPLVLILCQRVCAYVLDFSLRYLCICNTVMSWGWGWGRRAPSLIGDALEEK